MINDALSNQIISQESKSRKCHNLSQFSLETFNFGIGFPEKMKISNKFFQKQENLNGFPSLLIFFWQSLLS